MTGPLAGRRLVVTRGTEKGDVLDDLLRAGGAQVVRVPLIETEVLATRRQVRSAVRRLQAAKAGRWMVVTSEVAADRILTATDGRRPADVKIAAVGPATAAALRTGGLSVDLVPCTHLADSLGDELATRDIADADVLVVVAEGGRDVIVPRLQAAGARVERLVLYRSVMPLGAEAALRTALLSARTDAITFTSASTARNCARALGASRPPAGCLAGCIGPITASAAKEAGWREVMVATPHTAEGLAASLVARLGSPHRLP